MAAFNIAVLSGDGIGPEVTAQAVRVLRAVAKGAGARLEFEEALCGGCAIDATGAPLPLTTVPSKSTFTETSPIASLPDVAARNA